MSTLKTIIACIFGIALAASAMAVDFTDTAPVIASAPNYRQVSAPRQECWMEDVPVQVQPQERSNTGVLLGSIAGGILGNQVGGGRGRNAATLAGAVLGAVTGERLDNPQQQPQYTTQQVRRCRMVSDVQQELSGYKVTYRYGGKDVMVAMAQHPGSAVKVGVGVMQ